MDLIRLVGRPLPPLPAARDVVLHALSRGHARAAPEADTRLWCAMQELLRDGMIVKDGETLRLTPGAGDAAAQAAVRVSEFRAARYAWGQEMQAALRARREDPDQTLGSTTPQ